MPCMCWLCWRHAVRHEHGHAGPGGHSLHAVHWRPRLLGGQAPHHLLRRQGSPKWGWQLPRDAQHGQPLEQVVLRLLEQKRRPPHQYLPRPGLLALRCQCQLNAWECLQHESACLDSLLGRRRNSAMLMTHVASKAGGGTQGS